MNENKKSFELTKKGKIILGVALVLIIGIIIFFVVASNNKNEDAKLLADSKLAITVTPQKSSGSSMTLSPGNETTAGIKVGGKADLTYAFDKDIDQNVEWIISDTSIAKEENGVLVGLKAGSIEIYAVATNNKEIKSNTVNLNISE